MKKMIIFSIIGALVLFIWQFLSNAYPNFHQSSTQYTNKQDTILSKLNDIGLAEGRYILGLADPSLTEEQQSKMNESLANKPWAILSYHKSNNMDMTMPIIRSLINGFVISLLLFWIFTHQKNPTLKSRILISLSIGLISFFYVPYSNFIWYKDPGIYAYFADGIFPWVILGFIGNKLAK